MPDNRSRPERLPTQTQAQESISLSCSLAFRAEKSLTEYKDKLPANIVSEIQGHVDSLKKALEGQDNALIKAKTAELQEHMQKIGEELSKAGAQAAGPGPSAPGAQKAEKPDIEDAEVEIVDDKK